MFLYRFLNSAAFFVVLVFSLCKASSQRAPDLLTEQFIKVDSALGVINTQPEVVVVKEKAPAEDLFNQILKENNYFYALIRTDSKGNVINNVINENLDQNELENVSKKEWFKVPQDEHINYYGPVVTVHGRYYLIWSRPILIESVVGISKSLGTLAALVNISECLKQFEAAYNSPFELLYKGKSFYHFSWDQSDTTYEQEQVLLMGGLNDFTLRYRLQSALSSDSLTRPIVDTTKATLSAGTNLSSSKQKRKKNPFVLYFSLSTILILGIIAIVIYKRKNKPIESESDIAISDQERMRITSGETDSLRKLVLEQIYTEIKEQVYEKESKQIENEIRNTMQDSIQEEVRAREIARLRKDAEIEIAESLRMQLRDDIRDEILKTEKDQIEASVRMELLHTLNAEYREKNYDKLEREIKESLQKEIEDLLKAELDFSIRQEAITSLTASINEEVKNREQAILFQQVRERFRDQIEVRLELEEGEKLREELRSEFLLKLRTEVNENDKEYLKEIAQSEVKEAFRLQIRKEQAESIIKEERDKLAEEVRATIVEKYSGILAQEAREVIRKEIAENVRTSEREKIETLERQKFANLLRETVLKNEREKLLAEVREKVCVELADEIRAKEKLIIMAALRAELSQALRQEILSTEKDHLREEQRLMIAEELHNEVISEELSIIRSVIRKEVEEQERLKLDRDERFTIAEKQRQLIISEEYGKMREEIRVDLKNKELAELTSELTENIEKELTKKIRDQFDKNYAVQLEEDVALIRQKITSEFKSQMKELIARDRISVFEELQTLTSHASNTETLKSLQVTLALLLEEQEKFRYFNLNAAQTKSLIEYLQRLDTQFGTYFEQLDKMVKRIVADTQNAFELMGDTEPSIITAEPETRGA